MTTNSIVDVLRCADRSADGIKLIIPVGTKLWRGNEKYERVLKERFCNDTHKSGAYLSCNSPYLSETMVTEYDKALAISTYETIYPIVVYNGKYGFRCEQFKDNENIPHIDTRICGICSTIDPKEPYAELFITKDQFYAVKFTGYYVFTVAESIAKWGYTDRWLRQTVDLSF